MIAYLDNNLIVDIEQGKKNLKQIIENVDPSIDKVYFSSAHINEMIEITGSTETEKQERINLRLKTIEEITKNSYIHENMENQVFFMNESPQSVLETIQEVPATEIMKAFTSIIEEEKKQEFRDMLGIDPKRINNYSPSEVISQLNTKLTNWGMNQSFMEIIEFGISHHPQSDTFGLSYRVSSIFELLDMIGYWKDRVTENSNYSRFWDGNHTFFAAHCNYFISDDKRTRNKANVVYNHFGIGTIVISSQGKE